MARPRRQVHVAVPAAVMDQAEQRQQPCPGAEALVHRVGIAAGVGSQPLEQAGDGIVVGVDGAGRHQAAVLGVEQEDEPQQHAEQTGVDLVRIAGQHVAQQVAVPLIVRRLEAAE